MGGVPKSSGEQRKYMESTSARHLFGVALPFGPFFGNNKIVECEKYVGCLFPLGWVLLGDSCIVPAGLDARGLFGEILQANS